MIIIIIDNAKPVSYLYFDGHFPFHYMVPDSCILFVYVMSAWLLSHPSLLSSME